MAVALVLTGCGDFLGDYSSPEPPPRMDHVTGIIIGATELSLMEGQGRLLLAQVDPPYATDPRIDWSSSNDTVATVSAKGTVLAKGQGMATITASSRDGGITATCQVTVTPAVPLYSTDVYTAGRAVNAAGMTEAKLWVGGIEQYLELKHGGLGPSQARGVVVAPNGDVYVGGRETRLAGAGQTNYVNVYWKNGERFALDPEDGTYHGNPVHGLALYGNDLYLWGGMQRMSQTPAQSTRACFWKVTPDGKITRIDLTSGLSGTLSYCTGVAVSGSDVYAVFFGTSNLDGTVVTSANSAKLWKASVNDLSRPVVTELPSPRTGATTVTGLWVYEGSVYAVGSSAGTPTMPILWKDGAIQSFTYDTTRNATVSKGASYDGNIYMAGTQAFEATPTTRAQLWTNGIPQTLSDGTGTGATTATCVFANASGVYVGGFNNLTNRNPLVWINGVSYRHAAGGATEPAVEGIFVR
jgi:hypothetical protein